MTAQRDLEVPSSKPLNEERKIDFDESKKRLEWRTRPGDKPGAWYSKFKVFLEDENEKETKENMFVRIAAPIDFSPSALKKLYQKNLEKKERFMQQYMPERQDILGNDLAAAHFLVHRNGKVRFEGEPQWHQIDKEGNYTLPDRYVHGLFLEAIDCEGVKLYYEGLENIHRLRNLRWCSFKNMTTFDDWCLDRMSGSEMDSLEVLDLSGTNVSSRGLQALYRIPTLKKLILTDPYRDMEWKLTVAMLQEIMTDLEIVEITNPVTSST